MGTQDFLRAVLGDEGYYCAVGITSKKAVIQKFYPSIDALMTTAKNFADEGIDAYFGLATFTDGRQRRADKIQQLRSFFLDIDCGGGKDYHYPTQSDAFLALRQFCKDNGFPKPWVVNSGRGLHVYWGLAEPVSIAQWQPVAHRLKETVATYGLKADPAPTADPARILRVPGTLNYKGETPHPVEVLQVGAAVEFDRFKNLFGDVVERPSYVPRELSETTKALMGSMQASFKKILDRGIAGDGCAQITELVTNQAEVSEPLWRAGLSVAQHCSDRAKAIHFISRRHPDYDPDDTEEKAAAIKGPYTCDTFRTLNPDGCTGCPHKIKSPIVLGKEVAEATEEDNVLVEEGQTYVVPKLPTPYFRGKNGGVFKRVQEEDEVIEVPVYHNDIYVLRRVTDEDCGESIVVRLHLPKDGVRDFAVPLSAVLSKDDLRKHLAAQGVAVVKVDELMFYLAAWTNELQFQSMADQSRRQFGWTSDKLESFAWGAYEVFPDKVQSNIPSPATSEMFRHMRAKGSLEEWTRAMEFYKKPGMEPYQFLIGLGFGSIFTALTPVNCAHFHMYSPESGFGKTTTLLAAMSIWGDPYQLMLKKEDTNNTKMHRAEVFKNIFLPMDELTNATANELSDLLYQSSSGMQKGRMMGSMNRERARGLVWQTMFASTGNVSILEKISTVKALPKGEAMRMLEYRVAGVANLEKEETDALSRALLNHHGVAALPFLQYVMANLEAVRALFASVQATIDKAAKFGPADRFHSAQLACSVTGLLVARKAGLLSYDTRAVTAWAIGMAATARERVVEMDTDAEVVISNYVAENYTNVLRIKSTDDVRINGGNALDHLVVPDGTPRSTFAIRYEYDVKKMYIVIKPFREWCIKQQIHYSGVLEALGRGRTAARVERKRIGKGTRMNLPPMPVIVLDCKGFMDDELDAAALPHKPA